MLKLSMEQLNRPSATSFAKQKKMPITVVLDNVRSMHNVGSIFRTADGFAVENICLCGYTPLPPHRDINKTALGATDTVPWIHHTNTSLCLQQLTTQGYTIYAVEQVTQSIALHQFTPIYGKVAIVFGNEVDGVSNDALLHCNHAIEITQLGTKHSLNISVAAGIVLYKFFEHFLPKHY